MSSESVDTMSYSNSCEIMTAGNPSSDFGTIFIHGWGCRASDFEAVLDHSSKTDGKFRLVAINLPGHGQTSTQLCAHPTISVFAGIVLRVCTELGLKDVILVGHSMGVRITAQAALLASKSTKPTIKGLVWIDGSSYMQKETPVSNMASMTAEDRAAAKQKIFQQMFSRHTPESFKVSAVAHVAQMDKAYGESLMMDMMRWDREEMEGAFVKLGEMSLPVLNLQSSEPVGMDRVPMREGHISKYMRWVEGTMSKGYRSTSGYEKELTTPNLEQTAIAESAHFPHVDRPDVVAAQIRDFVERVAPH